jgi:tetratricopeptide (TPR) repeat protein
MLRSRAKAYRILALMGAAAALVSAPAFANSGGGGGGGSAPMPSRPQVNPQESFREGYAALEAGDYRKAEKKFGEVLSVAPKHPEANFYMGVAKVGLGKTKSSIKYFEKAIKEKETFTEARERLALVSIELGDLETANEQLAAMKEQEVKCGGACTPAYAQRLAEAIARVEAALAPPAETPADTSADDAGADPEAEAPEGSGDAEEEDVGAAEPSPQTFGGLFLAPEEEGVARYHGAVGLINEERFEEAIASLYEAQAIVGPHPDILNYLGYSHRKLGLFEKAEDYYHQALALDPAHLGAHEYLGELYLETGDMDKAKAQLAKLDALCPFGCADREDLARLIAIKETTRSAARE